MTWYVIKDNKVLKDFPHKEQCVVWCFEKGYIMYARGKNHLNQAIRITDEPNLQEEEP